MNVESVSCEVSNGTIYIYDQYGNQVNVLSVPGLKYAHSTGRYIIAETESMSYTYKVRCDGSIEQTGLRGRPSESPSDDLIPKVSNRAGHDSDSLRWWLM